LLIPFIKGFIKCKNLLKISIDEIILKITRWIMLNLAKKWKILVENQEIPLTKQKIIFPYNGKALFENGRA
jgi:hypothetical protein